jgi:hypothetical protein
MISKIAIDFSSEVLGKYYPERGDRLLYITTEVAKDWDIEMETITDYVTPHLLDLLTKECRDTNLVEDIPESDKTFEIF